MLPEDLEEALKDFEGDFCGPWRALGLEANVEMEELARPCQTKCLDLHHAEFCPGLHSSQVDPHLNT